MSDVFPPASVIQARRIVFLDWLRVIAFMSVLVGHQYATAYSSLMADEHTQPTLRWLLQALLPLIQYGGAGVLIFFMVSGYIIVSVLMKESGSAFLIRRFFRIYPLYAAALILELLFEHYRGSPFRGWGTVLAQLSLFGDFLQTAPALNGVEWSLRVEVLFYLYMAGLKFAGVIDGRFRRALPAILWLSALVIAWMAPFPGKWNFFFGYLNLYGPFLFLGTAIWACQQRRMGAWSCSSLFFAVMISYWVRLPVLQPDFAAAHFAAYGLLVFLLFWWLRDKLSIAWAGLMLSELTYGVYLFHNWLYEPIFHFAKAWAGAAWAAHGLALLALFGFCAVMIRLVERPAIRLGHRLSARWSRQAIAA